MESNVSQQEVKETATTPELQATPKDPMEQASMLFGMYYPIFVNSVYTLKNKSLRRLILSLVSAPLKDPLVNLNRTEEKQAYAIGRNLLEANMVMTLHTLYKHSEAVNAATQQQDANLQDPKQEGLAETPANETEKQENTNE